MSDDKKKSPRDEDDFGFIESGDADDVGFAFEGMPDAPTSRSPQEHFGFGDEDEFQSSHPDIPDAEMSADDDGFKDDADDGVGNIPRPDPAVNMRTRRIEVEESQDANLFGDLDGASESDPEEEEDEEEAPVTKGSGKGRLIFYAAAAAAVLGVGLVGYNFVLPRTGLTGPLTASVEPAVGNFDDVVPRQGMSSAEMGMPASVGAASLPGAVPVSLPAETADEMDRPVELPADGPVRTVRAALAVPDAPPEPFSADPIRLPSDGSAPSSPDAESLRRDVDSLVRERDAIQDRFEALEKRFASLEKSMPDTAPLPMVEPPAKPQVVDNWTLKGVLKGVAWIDGPTGFREVRPGDAVEGVGTVKDITRYENAWVVVTTRGVILQGE